MDEVFLIGSKHCPRCKGLDKAYLFARAVNDCYTHLVNERGVEMLIWGDRLLDGATTGYGEWEAAMNGTQSAVDLIPKDIIQVDWHYTNAPLTISPLLPGKRLPGAARQLAGKWKPPRHLHLCAVFYR
jgi:hypothetical protein